MGFADNNAISMDIILYESNNTEVISNNTENNVFWSSTSKLH